MHYLYIGHYKTDTQNNVWGIVQLTDYRTELELIYGMANFSPFRKPDKFLTFWGRAGGKMQSKIWEGRSWEAEKKAKLKRAEGYKRIDKARLGKISTGATEEIEKIACVMILSQST